MSEVDIKGVLLEGKERRKQTTDSDSDKFQYHIYYCSEEIAPRLSGLTLGGLKSKKIFNTYLEIIENELYHKYKKKDKKEQNNNSFKDEQLEIIKKLIPSTISTHLSYDFVEIINEKKITNEKKENVSIIIDHDIKIPSKNVEIGIEFNIFTDREITKLSGWLHHYIILLINKIKGISYNSTNNLPEIYIKTELLNNFNTPNEFFKDLAEFIIKKLKEEIFWIKNVSIKFFIGKKSILNNREKIELKIAKNRLDHLSQIISLGTANNSYELKKDDIKNDFISDNTESSKIYRENLISNLMNTKYVFVYKGRVPQAPYNFQIITPWHCEPDGYIFYNDLKNIISNNDILRDGEISNSINKNKNTENHETVDTKRLEVFKKLTKSEIEIVYLKDNKLNKLNKLNNLENRESGNFAVLNSWFMKNTFNKIKRINLWSLANPCPSPISSEIILFSISKVKGIGLVDNSYTKKTINSQSFKKMQLKYNRGLTEKGIRFLSIFDLYSPVFRMVTSNFNSICWINNDLIQRIIRILPKKLVKKIANEKDAKDLNSCLEYLENSEHPLMKPTHELVTPYRNLDKKNPATIKVNNETINKQSFKHEDIIGETETRREIDNNIYINNTLSLELDDTEINIPKIKTELTNDELNNIEQQLKNLLNGELKVPKIKLEWISPDGNIYQITAKHLKFKAESIKIEKIYKTKN